MSGIWDIVSAISLALQAKFGNINAGNYTEIEPDGTLKFNGNASTWVDIDFPIIIRTTGTAVPTISNLQGNLTAPAWQVNDNAVCETQEFVHSWKEGSETTWHVHITTGGTDTTDRFLRFEVEFTWANFMTKLPANTIITSPDLLIPANTLDRTHLIFNLGTFTPVGGYIGAHVKARLKRVSSVGAAPSGNPFCEMLQLHIEQDTTGSRLITTK